MLDLIKAIRACLISPNEPDVNGEPANIVDALCQLARALHDLADAIRSKK